MDIPPATHNAAATILKQRLKTLGWTIEGFLDRLADHGHPIDRSKFNNYCRPINTDAENPKRRNRGFPKNIKLIMEIVRVLVEDPPLKQRWTPREALEFAIAAGQPAAALMELAKLFEDRAAFVQAYRELTSDAETQLHHLAFEALDTLPPHRVPQRAQLPPRTSRPFPEASGYFRGRDRELRALGYAFKTTPNIRYVLCGMPGLGKTALAIEFAHRYGQYFQGGVFFLAADTLDQLYAGLITLGRETLALGPRFDALRALDSLREMRSVLERQPPCLLIIDNIDALRADEIEAVLPTVGECRILMTSRALSRYPSWHEHELSTLATDESVKLLFQLCAIAADEQPAYDSLARRIAELLGDLPLALTLIGAHVRSRYASAAEVLADLAVDLQSDAVASHIALGNQQQDGPADRALERRLDALLAYVIAGLDPAHPIHGPARALLAIAAVFAPGQPIDRGLLRDISQCQGIDVGDIVHPVAYVDDALKELRSRALLGPASHDGLSLHRLLRSYVRGHLDLRPAVVRAVDTLWRRLVSDLPDAEQEALEYIQPYDLLLRTLADDAVHLDIARAAEICYLLGWYLNRNSEHAAALYWLERSVALARRRYGSAHPITAEAWCRLGICHVFRNEHTQARQAYEEMMAIQRQIYPSDHIERLVGYLNMGQILVIDGDYVGSQHYTRLAFRGFRAIQHSADADQRLSAAVRVARCLRVLGQNAMEAGRYRRAYRYFGAAQRCQSTNRKLDAQLTWDLGLMALALGRFDEAHGLMTEALEARRTLHANCCDDSGQVWHQDIAESLLGLGKVALLIGDLERAERQSREALLIHTEMLGPDSYEAGETSEQLGEIALQSGQIDRAIVCLSQAAANYRRIFPSGMHTKLLQVHLRLARVALLRDQLDIASEECITVSQDYAALGMPEHPCALWATACLAEIARRQQRLGEAQHLWGDVSSRLRHAQGGLPALRRLASQDSIPVLSPLDLLF